MQQMVRFEISINKLLGITFLLMSILTGLGLNTIWYFEKNLLHLQKENDLLKENNLIVGKAIEELRLIINNNSIEVSNELLQKAKTLTPQTLNSLYLSPEHFKILMYSLLVIGAIVGSGYLISFFFKETIVGKLLVGVNSFGCSTYNYFFNKSAIVKSFFIQYKDLELRFDLHEDKSGSVCWRAKPDDSFLPFERYLEQQQIVMDGKDLNIANLLKDVQNGKTENIVSTFDSMIKNSSSENFGQNSNLNSATESTINSITENTNKAAESFNLEVAAQNTDVKVTIGSIIRNTTENLDTVIGNNSPGVIALWESATNNF